MTIHKVTINFNVLVEVDDEDEDVQNYLKSGGSIQQYVEKHWVWDENLGTYKVELK